LEGRGQRSTSVGEVCALLSHSSSPFDHNPRLVVLSQSVISSLSVQVFYFQLKVAKTTKANVLIPRPNMTAFAVTIDSSYKSNVIFDRTVRYITW